ncbi:hypothetical protein [Microbispora sp. H13382]|uniref:hypothetical protein n=1 Tax=Microbispora sp. H13382 TaxID=2729112 RepID=UPI001601480C|nr:hypothetical protein [Microbispora sp. H13382]
MWRTRGFRLWVLAIVMTLLPLAPSAFSESMVSFGFTTYGVPDCPAFDFQTTLFSAPIMTYLLGWHLFAVPLAFAFWLVTRGGRASRVTGRVAACYVLLMALVNPALVAYDVVTAGSGCWRLWEPLAVWNLGVSACDVTAATLVLWAVRPAGSRPHARLRRTAGVFGVCCLLLAAPVADRGADDRYTGLDVAMRVYAQDPGTDGSSETERLFAAISAYERAAEDEGGLSEEDDCGTWTVLHQSYGDTPPRDRERAFLCTARDVAGYAPRLVTLPDRELLAFGRALCGVAGRPSTEPRVRTLLDQAGAYDWSWSLMNALVFLCPDAVAPKWPDLVLSEAEGRKEEDDYLARMTAHCSDPARRLRAVRQATTALSVGEGGGYLVEGDTYGSGVGGPRRLDRAFDRVIDWLTTTAVSVGTAVENSPICLTVKALNQAPRSRLKGWDTVTETGISSVDGRIELLWEGDGSLPNLAVAGSGRYRVRVYVRGQEKALAYASEGPVEEHLVLVFPGSSGKTLFLRG